MSSFELACAVTAADGGAQLTHHVVGTQGYLTPECLKNSLITPKVGVFGGILLELLCGKDAAFVDDAGEETLLWESAEEALVDTEGQTLAFSRGDGERHL